MKAKKLLSLLLLLVMTMAMFVPGQAATNIKVYIDNEIVSFDIQPRLVGGRTMVPLRAIFEGLGATVDWNGDTQTVTAFNEVTIVTATIGQYTMTVNGTKKTMDVAPMVIDNRTLVPARFVAEAFDCDVRWDGSTQTVYITTKPLDYSKVEQDISVAIPGTSTKTETKSDVQEESAQETTKSDKPYKVETLNADKCDMHEAAGVLKKYRCNFFAMTQVDDDIYYANRKNQIIKINIISGETSTYRELKKATVKINDKVQEVDVTAITCLYYDNARDSVNCLFNWEWYDILEETTLERSSTLNLSTMKEITNNFGGAGVMEYIYGTNENGDIFVPVVPGIINDRDVGYKAIATLRFPDFDGCWDIDGKFKCLNGKFNGKLEEIYGDTPVDVQLINGDLWYFNEGEVIGIDENYLYIMNDNYLVKTDHDRNIIENCKYIDIELADSVELFNKKYERLFISSKGDVVFYDEDLGAFRKISKN